MTNKRNAERQIAKRVRRLERANLALDRKQLHSRKRQQAPEPEDTSAEGDSDLRYHISASKRNPQDIFSTIRNNRGDPAFHVCFFSFELLCISTNKVSDILKKFLPKLQDHLLGRLMDRKFDGDMHEEFTDTDRNSIRFMGSKIYSVQTYRVYYTTYDLQRQCDVVNPRAHPDIMLRSPAAEGAEPYWYARVIGVYHANVWTEHPAIRGGRNARRMDFLWVRWFGDEPGYRSGFRRARLPKIGFVESTDDFAFSFVDPANVICGCHLIPAFDAGWSADLLPHSRSIARCLNPEDTDDWLNFYVNM
jgi:hypothetical protein